MTNVPETTTLSTGRCTLAARNTQANPMEMYTMPTPFAPQSTTPTLRNAARGASLLALAGLLAGCAGSGIGGNFGLGAPVTAAKTSVHGNVHGGQQPVAGATIQIWTVGTSGIGSASTALIAGSVTTDSNGNFNIPNGSYDCSIGTEVYITASNGDPSGGTNSYNNTAIRMAAPLGNCAYVLANAASISVNINELSTVAFAYSVAGFATSSTQIGAAGAYNAGLVTAFATAQELVGLASGQVGGNVAPGEVLPSTEMYTLANILASCINTGGPAVADQNCADLQTATGGTNSFDHALAFAKNPASTTLTALYVKSPGTAPFQPSYSSQPNDFALAVKYNGGGSTLNLPYGIAIDASGNAWVTNVGGSTVTELGPQGTVKATPTATNLYGAQGIAVDRSGNVWVANTAGNSLVKFTLTSGTITSTNSYTGVTAPSAVAIDSGNNAFVANLNGNSVSKFTSSGTASGPFTGSGNITVPSGIAVGPAGNVYVTSGTGVVVKLGNDGTYASSTSDNALQGPFGVAVDATNHIFATGSTTGNTVVGAVGEYTTAGAISAVSPVTSGLSTPFGVAVDGTSAWIANSAASGGLAQVKYGVASPASPTAGFLMQNTALNTPVGVAVDASGNVWTANSGDNTVTKFIGIAVPVATPLAANVGP